MVLRLTNRRRSWRDYLCSCPLSSACVSVEFYLLVTPSLIVPIIPLSVPNDTVFVASAECPFLATLACWSDTLLACPTTVDANNAQATVFHHELRPTVSGRLLFVHETEVAFDLVVVFCLFSVIKSGVSLSVDTHVMVVCHVCVSVSPFRATVEDSSRMILLDPTRDHLPQLKP